LAWCVLCGFGIWIMKWSTNIRDVNYIDGAKWKEDFPALAFFCSCFVLEFTKQGPDPKNQALPSRPRISDLPPLFLTHCWLAARVFVADWYKTFRIGAFGYINAKGCKKTQTTSTRTLPTHMPPSILACE
jgi:hypothetical protein